MSLVKWIVAVALLASLPFAAQAQTPAEFYKGKQVSLYIGFSAGGGYDLYARTLARHMGKHIPGNPQVVPKNMDGAGSLRASNFIYQAAPRDGTAFGASGRATPMSPLFGQSAAQFDARKYTWLGSANDEVSLCIASQASGITQFDDLRKSEKSFGSTGPTEEGVAGRQDHERAARNENQDRHRLSRQQRDQSGDRARRDRRPLRDLLVEHQVDHAAARRSEEDHDPAHRSRSPSIPNCPTCRCCRISRPPMKRGKS